MALDNFEFSLVEEFIGYNSSRDKTNVAPNTLIRGSQNVYKKLSGTIASRFGLKRRGTADSTLAGVKSSFEWNNSLGLIYPLRVENGKLEFESTIAGVLTWTALLTGLTKTRFVFDTWWDNTEKKDRVVFVDGDGTIQHWSGGVANVLSTTINTITKSGTATWQQAGFATNTSGDKKLTINGHPYTYTGGEGTTTLTGVTGDPTGEAIGSMVVQTVIVETTSPASGFNADFIKTIGNRIHVGSYSSRLVYISAQNDFRNFSVSTPRAAGDPELLTLDNNAVGIGVRVGNAHISAGSSDWYEVVYTDLTVGSIATQRTDVNKTQVPNLSAALAHEFIDSSGGDIIFFSQDFQLRMLGTFKDVFSTTKYPSISQQVQDELKNIDWTGGALRTIGEFTYITSPNTGIHYMYQVRESVEANGLVSAERIWHPPQVSNISRFALIAGVVYGHSNANPQIYQVWDTAQYHDDLPTGEAAAYVCIMRMAYRQLKTKAGTRRQGLADFDKTFFEGYMTPGTNLYCNVLFDYQGSTNIQQVTINGQGSFAKSFIGQIIPVIGNDVLGDNPLGDGIIIDPTDQELLPKFRAIRNVTPNNCFEYTLEIVSFDVDSRWEMLALGVNAQESTQQSGFLIKSN